MKREKFTNLRTVIYETLSTQPYPNSPGSEFLDALKDLDQVVDQKDFKMAIESFFQQSAPKSSTSQSGSMTPG